MNTFKSSLFQFSFWALFLTMLLSVQAQAGRQLISPPLRKKITFELPYPKSSPPVAADKKIPQALAGIYAILTLTNISKTTQHVKVTLMKDSRGEVKTYSPVTKNHVDWKDKGWFVSYGGFTGTHPNDGLTLNQDTGCTSFSTASQITPSGTLTLDAYSSSPTAPNNSTQTVAVGFYGGRRPCMDGGLTADDFQHAECTVVGDAGDKCARMFIGFSPQILIEVSDDLGAIVGSVTFESFTKIIGGGTFAYGPLEVVSGVADVKAYPQEFDNGMVLLNGGRPF